MTTQLEYARLGTVTEEMKVVAKPEGLSEQFICEYVARGEIFETDITYKR